MTSPEAALAFCRFVQDAAALLLWGACAYLAWLVPPDLAAVLETRLRFWLATWAAAAAAATAATLPVEVATIGAGWRDALDPAMVRAVLVETGGGRAWTVQAGAAVLLVALCRAPPRARLAGTAGAAALMLAGLALTGHAVAGEGWTGAAHRAVEALHVLSAGAWLGALVPVALILPRLARPEARAAGMLALRRFSRAGLAAVATVLLTGAANAALRSGLDQHQKAMTAARATAEA